MRVSRFFIESPLFQGQQLTLPAHLVNYIVNVLRLKKEDKIILFNDQTLVDNTFKGEFQATLTEINKRHVTVQIEQFTEKKAESHLQLHLFQGISRSERMDFSIQKSVELGITEITPVLTQRSNLGKFNDKRLTKKMQHWQGVAISACEQSGRTDLVTINPPIPVTQLKQQADINLLLSPDANQRLSELIIIPPKTINILIGPEGGLTDNEIQIAGNNHYQNIKLGVRILRTETATLSIVSVLQFLYGDLS
jgi:16S rRNA (uracil1498-N3)-methyltransferase